MGIVEYIKALMEADRNARMTYKEVANKYCLPLYTVHRLLTGKQSFSSLKLATIEEMFPNARLECLRWTPCATACSHRRMRRTSLNPTLWTSDAQAPHPLDGDSGHTRPRRR